MSQDHGHVRGKGSSLTLNANIGPKMPIITLMAKVSGKVFVTQLNAMEKLARDLGMQGKKYDIVMQKRMQVATDMVWRLAHQKRPMITKAMARKGRLTKMGNISYRRVSDPNAKLGVPVDTGLLQSAVKKEVTRVGYGKFQGMVYVDETMAPYGKDMEYGTAKVHARPFMRPAWQLTQEAIRKLFASKPEIK